MGIRLSFGCRSGLGCFVAFGLTLIFVLPPREVYGALKKLPFSRAYPHTPLIRNSPTPERHKKPMRRGCSGDAARPAARHPVLGCNGVNDN